MSEELKPCPFCGGDKTRVERTLRDGYKGYEDDPDAYAYYVFCSCCAAQGPWLKSSGGAVRKWNTRPAEDRLQGQLDEAHRDKDALRAEVERLTAEVEAAKGYCHEQDVIYMNYLTEVMRVREENKRLTAEVVALRAEAEVDDATISALIGRDVESGEEIARLTAALAEERELCDRLVEGLVLQNEPILRDALGEYRKAREAK